MEPARPLIDFPLPGIQTRRNRTRSPAEECRLQRNLSILQNRMEPTFCRDVLCQDTFAMPLSGEH